MNKTIKPEAIKLRTLGESYNVISKKLNVPKGTLSYWFKNLRESKLTTKRNIAKAKKQWAANITKYNKKRSLIARKKWIDIQNKNTTLIKQINNNELMLIGTALYWAEGYKRGNWNVIFCNADPEMNKLMIKFFIKICKVPPEKIKAQIQLHNNIPPVSALKYWSKITGLTHSQFLKTVFYKNNSSKGMREKHLPYGTLRIRINDVVLVNKIKGWIGGLIEQINKTGRSSVG
jgi:hypothetical protein